MNQTFDPAAMAALQPLVIKRGLSLGGLAPPQRAWLLGLVWAGLGDRPMNEREVNDNLKAQLEGAAACLDTDHVELRRWLVDSGWMWRDGFCREYRKVQADAVPEAQGAVPRALARWTAAELSGWVAACVDDHAAMRAMRRQRWQGTAGAAAGP
jgi:hypothetical protein